MNVIITNGQQKQLQNIEVDIIKSINGQYEAVELVDMFKNFFFNKMILDVTALKNYNITDAYKILVNGLNPDKIIFFIPEGTDLCTSGFLSSLIKLGIYNFTTNIEGVKYLVKHTNTYNDVESIIKMSAPKNVNTSSEENFPKSNNDNNKVDNKLTANKFIDKQVILGIQNVTSNAGATSLIYMMKKELDTIYKNDVLALELDKTDFRSFNDKGMISASSNEIENLLEKINKKIILIDLNNSTVEKICTKTIYLMEPSTIKLNTLMRKNRVVLEALKNKDVILNKSLLSQKEVGEFEFESGIKITYNMPPLNDRKRNQSIVEFLKKIELINSDNSSNSNRIFGLFRK